MSDFPEQILDPQPSPAIQTVEPPQKPKRAVTTRTEPSATLPAVTASPMQLLQAALDRGVDLQMVEKLMDLQDRFEKSEAKKAFVHALAAFKADPPEVIKNRKAEFESKRTGGTTSYAYATLDQVCDAVAPALAAHGLIHTWQIDQTPIIKVTCRLQHELGHTESVAMEGPRDDSGQKNAIQQIASTVSYLQRYTLLAITGLAASNQDDDAHGSEAAPRPRREQYSGGADIQEAPDPLHVGVPLNDSGFPAWPAWRLALTEKMRGANGLVALNAIWEANRASLVTCERDAPNAHSNALAAFDARREELTAAPGGASQDEGLPVSFDDPDKALSGMLEQIAGAEQAGEKALEELWEGSTLTGELREAGFPEMAQKIHDEYTAAMTRAIAKRRATAKSDKAEKKAEESHAGPIPAIGEKPPMPVPMPLSKYENAKRGVDWEVFGKALIARIEATPPEGITALAEKYKRELEYFSNYKPKTHEAIATALDAKR